jgi:L-2-hydroxyglutarate oxidase LhgO
VIVALRDDELPQLFGLADRAKANGIAGSRVIDTSELHDREPHVRGLSALLIPETAVVDFRLIAEELAADVVRIGGEVILGHPVTEIHAGSSTVRARCCRGANTSSAKAGKHRSLGHVREIERHRKGFYSEAGLRHFPASKALPHQSS